MYNISILLLLLPLCYGFFTKKNSIDEASNGLRLLVSHDAATGDIKFDTYADDIDGSATKIAVEPVHKQWHVEFNSVPEESFTFEPGEVFTDDLYVNKLLAEAWRATSSSVRFRITFLPEVKTRDINTYYKVGIKVGEEKYKVITSKLVYETYGFEPKITNTDVKISHGPYGALLLGCEANQGNAFTRKPSLTSSPLQMIRFNEATRDIKFTGDMYGRYTPTDVTAQCVEGNEAGYLGSRSVVHKNDVITNCIRRHHPEEFLFKSLPVHYTALITSNVSLAGSQTILQSNVWFVPQDTVATFIPIRNYLLVESWTGSANLTFSNNKVVELTETEAMNAFLMVLMSLMRAKYITTTTFKSNNYDCNTKPQGGEELATAIIYFHEKEVRSSQGVTFTPTPNTGNYSKTAFCIYSKSDAKLNQFEFFSLSKQSKIFEASIKVLFCRLNKELCVGGATIGYNNIQDVDGSGCMGLVNRCNGVNMGAVGVPTDVLTKHESGLMYCDIADRRSRVVTSKKLLSELACAGSELRGEFLTAPKVNIAKSLGRDGLPVYGINCIVGGSGLCEIAKRFAIEANEAHKPHLEINGEEVESSGYKNLTDAKESWRTARCFTKAGKSSPTVTFKKLLIDHVVISSSECHQPYELHCSATGDQTVTCYSNTLDSKWAACPHIKLLAPLLMEERDENGVLLITHEGKDFTGQYDPVDMVYRTTGTWKSPKTASIRIQYVYNTEEDSQFQASEVTFSVADNKTVCETVDHNFITLRAAATDDRLICATREIDVVGCDETDKTANFWTEAQLVLSKNDEEDVYTQTVYPNGDKLWDMVALSEDASTEGFTVHQPRDSAIIFEQAIVSIEALRANYSLMSNETLWLHCKIKTHVSELGSVKKLQLSSPKAITMGAYEGETTTTTTTSEEPTTLEPTTPKVTTIEEETTVARESTTKKLTTPMVPKTTTPTTPPNKTIITVIKMPMIVGGCIAFGLLILCLFLTIACLSCKAE